MKLAYYNFSEPFEWTGDNVCTIVLENKKSLRQFVLEMIEQSITGEGEFALSVDGTSLKFDKSVCVIGDIFNVDVSEDKSVTTAIQKSLALYAANEKQDELFALFEHINRTLISICRYGDEDVTFDSPNDVAALLKQYRVRPDTADLSMLEKIINYCELSRKYTAKRLFVIVGIRQYLDDDEAESFCQDLIFRKLNVLFVEPSATKRLPFEKVRIVDEDMCEI